MKKVNVCITCLLLMAVSIFYVACSKDGPAGPAGADGAAGPAGPAGTAGAKGDQGDPGTANVIYSAWLDVTYTVDTFTNGGVLDTAGYYAEITATKLDAAMLNTGEIKVYVNLNTAAAPSIVPLPYYSVYNNININPSFEAGLIFIYSNFNASTFTDNGSKIQQYRYILIPGGTTARMAKKINWNNYAEVKAYLKLKD